MVAKPSAHAEKNIINCIVVHLGRDRHLGYKKKWIWARAEGDHRPQGRKENEGRHPESPVQLRRVCRGTAAPLLHIY
jgi:hypothetical protein